MWFCQILATLLVFTFFQDENFIISQYPRGKRNILQALVFFDGEKCIIGGSLDGKIRWWETEKGKEKMVITNYSPVSAIAFWEYEILVAGAIWKNKNLLSGDYDGKIKLWDENGKFVRQIGKHQRIILNLTISYDGKMLASVGANDGIILWFLENNRKVVELTAGGKAHYWQCVAFTPDNSTLVAGTSDGEIAFFNLKTKTFSSFFSAHKDCIRAIKISRDGKILATASEDNTICLWELTNDKRIAQLAQLVHKDNVLAVDITPDGALLASGTTNKNAMIWDIEKKKVLFELKHEGLVTSVLFSSDGKKLATATINNSSFLWGVATGKKIMMFHGR